MRGLWLRVRAHLQILLHGHLQEDVASLGDLRQALLDDLVRRDALEVMVLKEDAARSWRCSRPEMVFRMVDLPAPFAPMSVTTSPSLTSKETPLTAWMLP